MIMKLKSIGASARSCSPSKIFLAATILFAGILNDAAARTEALSPKDPLDFYGISWRGDNQSNLQFAKQMGYDFVMYKRGMETNELASDLGFYLETPQSDVFPVPRNLNPAKTHPVKERELYEKYFAKKSDQPFPTNMATGWFSSATVFCVEPDHQKQDVNDYFVSRIIQNARSLERKNRNFFFAGYAWDVPNLTGDFWDKKQKQGGQAGGGRQITLAFWTGSDSAYKPEGATFQYPTYTDGKAAFYRQLFTQTRAQFPEAKFIVEPYKIWENWLALVKNRPDAKDFMPDLILQESGGNEKTKGTEFATDARIFNSGLIKGRGTVGSTTPNCFGEKENREIAAQAAVNGSVFGWFGRFGGTGNMPDYKNISEVPARLQLIRRVAAWENRNGIPLDKRFWDGNVYTSPTSHISENVIWSTHPKTGKIFVVWLKPDSVVKLPAGLKFESLQRTDKLFIESSSGLDDVAVKGNEVRLKNNEGIGKGYIISAIKN